MELDYHTIQFWYRSSASTRCSGMRGVWLRLTTSIVAWGVAMLMRQSHIYRAYVLQTSVPIKRKSKFIK